MEHIYDCIILGSGPAGLTAAIYGARGCLSTLVIEKEFVSGGQVVNTYEIDNYPGYPGIGGFDLGMKFREHAEHFGVEFATGLVTDISIEETVKKVITDEGEYYGRTIIIATGAKHKMLGVPGEEELAGMGVSYCATCDGAFFKGKTVAVVGGGDVALGDALFLSRICEKVYLIHRRKDLRGAKSLQEKVFAAENIELIWDSRVLRIQGEDQVESVKLLNIQTEETRNLPVEGVFVAVGTQPNSRLFENMLEMDEAGYVKAGEDCVTNQKGIFVAGDVRRKNLKQIVTAVADGANAVNSAQEYLLSLQE